MFCGTIHSVLFPPFIAPCWCRADVVAVASVPLVVDYTVDSVFFIYSVECANRLPFAVARTRHDDRAS